MRRRRRGLPLKELLSAIAILFVIFIIAFIIAFVTYSRLQYDKTMKRTHEKAAVRDIGDIREAEARYKAEYGRFATSLAQLGPPAGREPGPGAAELISRDMASGKGANYVFTLTGREGGYAIQALPTALRNSGRFAFYSDETLVIRRTAASPQNK